MMSVRQGKRNKYNNYNYNSSQRALNLHLTTQSPLLLLLSLMLCCEVIFMETIDAAELPTELMLESVGLLKSMEHAQQHQQLQQHRSGQQKGHMLHEQAKRFPFDTLNSASADVGIDNMQLSEMSPADFARVERELFLQSAIDETSLDAADDVELPLEPLSMEQHADLMEHAIDYKQQHQPTAMWLQQHGSSGGDGKKAGSVFLKFHHPHQQQHHQQQKHQQQHRLSGDAANSVTLAPPPMPVASPLRHCALEVCTKLRGVCQPMPTIGTACVAGDNIEVFHQDCM